MDKLDQPLDDVIADETAAARGQGVRRGGRPPKGGEAAPGGKVSFALHPRKDSHSR